MEQISSPSEALEQAHASVETNEPAEPAQPAPTSQEPVAAPAAPPTTEQPVAPVQEEMLEFDYRGQRQKLPKDQAIQYLTQYADQLQEAQTQQQQPQAPAAPAEPQADPLAVFDAQTQDALKSYMGSELSQRDEIIAQQQQVMQNDQDQKTLTNMRTEAKDALAQHDIFSVFDTPEEQKELQGEFMYRRTVRPNESAETIAQNLANRYNKLKGNYIKKKVQQTAQTTEAGGGVSAITNPEQLTRKDLFKRGADGKTAVQRAAEARWDRMMQEDMP
jgi:hypothetical protein